MEKLHNEELNDLYSSPNYSGDKIEKYEMGGACSAYGEERGIPRERGHLGDPNVDGRIIFMFV